MPGGYLNAAIVVSVAMSYEKLLAAKLAILRTITFAGSNPGLATTNTDIRLSWPSEADRPCVPNVSSNRKIQQKQCSLLAIDHHCRRSFTGFRWSISGWIHTFQIADARRAQRY
jgi:hypothetical protein